MSGPTFVTSDGVRLAYAVDDGTDPWRVPDTLVLLHAAMGNLRRFHAWIPVLARDFQVVRLDLRGHGASEVPPPDRALTLERLALDVGELLDHLGRASAHVAGTSAGGYVALQFALAHPARVKRLALVSSTPGLTHSTVRLGTWLATVRARGVEGLLAETLEDRLDPARVDPGFVQWMLAEARRMDREFAGRFLTAMAGVDLAGRLGEVRCPTLALVPGADAIGTRAGYEALRRIPDLHYVVYEGHRHNITNTVPERCAADLRRFLLGAPVAPPAFPGIRPGLRGEREFPVTEGMATTHAGGQGVLTTPDLISAIEDTAQEVTAPLLPPDHTTVGFEVAVRHMAAAPVGARVRIVTELLEVDGRKLLFRVEASTARGRIGDGTHRRTIVRLGSLGRDR